MTDKIKETEVLRKHIIGENGISYTLGEDGLYYPDIRLPEGTHYEIGRYGQMRAEYLKEYHRALYLELLLDGNLNELVLCQDLVQVKMRNFSHFNPPEAQPQCVFFYTIVRIHLVTYSYNGYEFVSYCRKLPDIRKSSSMPACNREF